MEELSSRWIVQPGEVHIRLDQYLARHITGTSRSQVQAWIRAADILVNGARTKTGYLVRPGDEIILHRSAEPPPLLRPEQLPVTVIYQDGDLAVIDKPAGMVCHVGAGVRSGTLVNALLHHLGPIEAGDPVRPGIVHRLDKLSSGLMVVAKNNPSHQALSRQFQSRRVSKEYLALVYGRPTPPAGTIDLPLGRDPKNRKKMSVHARRSRNAVTHYAVEREYGPWTLLRIRIETGRTHQIRVHLAHKGHPIVGDKLYGGNRSRTLRLAFLREALEHFQRVFLHSHRLEFHHPSSGDLVSFTSPLPSELEDFLKSIQQ